MGKRDYHPGRVINADANVVEPPISEIIENINVTTNQDVATALEWYKEHWPDGGGRWAQQDNTHDRGGSVDYYKYSEENIASSIASFADSTARTVQSRYDIITAPEASEDWSEEYKQLHASGQELLEDYAEAGKELQECLNTTTNNAKQALPQKMLNLKEKIRTTVGTNFEATLALPAEFTRTRKTGKRYVDAELPDGVDAVLYQHGPRLHPHSSTPIDYNVWDNYQHAQYIDIEEADRKKLKWPNYPIVIESNGERGPLNLAGEYHGPAKKTTNQSGEAGDSDSTSPTYGYPAGWATVMASIVNGLQRCVDFILEAPTYEQYEAENFDITGYSQKLLNIWLLTDPNLAPVSRRDDLGDSAISDDAGVLRYLKKLLQLNFKTAAIQFTAIDPNKKASENFGSLLKLIEADMNTIWGIIEPTLSCQINAIVDNAKADKKLADLLGNFREAGDDPDYRQPEAVAAAAAIAKRLAIRQVLGDFEGNNAAQDAAIAEEIVDNRNVLFKEQCFLLNYINLFLKQKIEEDTFLDETFAGNKRLPYAQALGPPGFNQDLIKDHLKQAKNASLLVSGDAYGFLNKMTLNPHLKHLINIDNQDLSLLQPSIRLFKIVYDEFGNDDYQVEMKFDSHFTANDLANFTLDTGARGAGAGIKNFTFAYEGSNPFAIKKSIKANLKIFGSTFSELTQERTGAARSLADHTRTGTRKFKYVDLALKTGRADHGAQDSHRNDCIDIREQNENLADLNFRLRAEVGWAPVAGTAGQLSPELISAVQSSYVTLNLTPTVHNFDFDDQGGVVMNINYLAYIEEYFDNKNFNIFANARTTEGAKELVTYERLKRGIVLEEIERKCRSDESSNTAAEVKEDFKRRIAKNSADALQQLISGLLERGEVNFLPIKKADLRSYFQNNGPETEAIVSRIVLGGVTHQMQSQLDLEGRIDDALEEFESQSTTDDADDAPEKDAIAAALIASEGDTTTISYFYLSRLVDLILENIDTELEILTEGTKSLTAYDHARSLILPSGTKYEINDFTLLAKKQREIELARENFKRLRIVLGPVEFVNSPSSVSRKVTNATFGDIPISVKYFVEYMTEKMLKKEEVFYSLTKFLNDLMNEFVRDFLNSRECFRNLKTKIRAQQASLTSWSPDKKYDILSIKIARTGTNNPVLSSGGNSAKPYQMEHTRAHRANINRLGSGASPVLYLSGPPGARTMISPDHEFNYFVYFAGQVQPIEKMKGERLDTRDSENGLIRRGDESRGIFHYMLGRDKGLIKQISLSKTQTKGLAEVRFEQDGYDGLRQLRVVYDVDIDCFANVNTYPGTYIYVDPSGFDPGYSNDKIKLSELGIGGYYMIIRSEHEFRAGTAATKITAKWVNQVEADAAAAACQSLRDSGTGTNDRMNSACATYAQERQDAADVVDNPPDRLFDLRWDGLTPW